MTTTNPEHLETLDDASLTILINHYLSVTQKLPNNLRVRDRLNELEQELRNRSFSVMEGMIRQTTSNPMNQ